MTEFTQHRDHGDEAPEQPEPLDVLGVATTLEDRLQFTKDMLNRAHHALVAQAREIITLRTMLSEVEWGGHPNLFECPVCHEEKVAGHKRYCQLGELLGRTGPQVCATGGGC